jgi:hypothetical protein
MIPMNLLAYTGDRRAVELRRNNQVVKRLSRQSCYLRGYGTSTPCLEKVRRGNSFEVLHLVPSSIFGFFSLGPIFDFLGDLASC